MASPSSSGTPPPPPGCESAAADKESAETSFFLDDSDDILFNEINTENIPENAIVGSSAERQRKKHNPTALEEYFDDVEDTITIPIKRAKYTDTNETTEKLLTPLSTFIDFLNCIRHFVDMCEGHHRYFSKFWDKHQPLMSVSTVIKNFSPVFPKYSCAKNIVHGMIKKAIDARGQIDKNHKYYNSIEKTLIKAGCTEISVDNMEKYRDVLGAAIIKTWDETGRNAASLGTKCHTIMEFICKKINGSVHSDEVVIRDTLKELGQMYGIEEKIIKIIFKFVMEYLVVVDEEVSYARIIADNPTAEKDNSIIETTEKTNNKPKWKIIASELGLSIEDLPIVGTADSLAINYENVNILKSDSIEEIIGKSLILLDWKFTDRPLDEVPYANGKYLKYMHGPLSFLKDTKLNRYTVQLNAYARLIEIAYKQIFHKNLTIVDLRLVNFVLHGDGYFKIIPVKKIPAYVIDEIFSLTTKDLLVQGVERRLLHDAGLLPDNEYDNCPNCLMIAKEMYGSNDANEAEEVVAEENKESSSGKETADVNDNEVENLNRASTSSV